MAALQAAGLEKWIVEVAAGFIPGAEGPEAVEDPADPCRDSVPLRHSHFFTADGQFGSRDQDGNEVDDGTYQIVDEGTFVVSKEFPDVTFHYSIEGDSITFEPAIPSAALTASRPRGACRSRFPVTNGGVSNPDRRPATASAGDVRRLVPLE